MRRVADPSPRPAAREAGRPTPWRRGLAGLVRDIRRGAAAAWRWRLDAPARRRLLWGAVAVATVAILAWALLTPAREAGPSTTTGRPLPAAPISGHLAPNITYQDLAGHHTDLASLRGKVVILNFWYVGCDGCQFEQPILERVYHAQRGHGVVVLGLDISDDPQTIAAYVARMGLDYPVVRDLDHAGVLDYQVVATPTTFVIDQRGVVRAKHVGAITDTPTLTALLPPLTGQP
jgi:peroxiredoxin